MTQAMMPLESVGAKRTGGHRGGRAQKYVLSDQGRRLLLERYDGTTQTLDELMRHFPGIPRRIVRKWAGQLGLARQKEPFWTPEEVAYLERTISRTSLRAIAKHLGRTQTAVKLKAKRLEMNKTQQEGYTMRALMLGLGTNHHRILYWIERGWLKGYRRHTERERDVWYFSDSAIRAFIKAHPEEIDSRKFDWLWIVDILVGGLGPLGQEEESLS